MLVESIEAEKVKVEKRTVTRSLPSSVCTTPFPVKQMPGREQKLHSRITYPNGSIEAEKVLLPFRENCYSVSFRFSLYHTGPSQFSTNVNARTWTKTAQSGNKIHRSRETTQPCDHPFFCKNFRYLTSSHGIFTPVNLEGAQGNLFYFIVLFLGVKIKFL